MKIKITLKGSFKNAERLFRNGKDLNRKLKTIFEKYGQMGVEALQSLTPRDTGVTADLWSYTVSDKGITWSNSNTISGGTPLVILLQFGHGTRGGGYVQGRDFINPALRPVFDQLSENCWEEVRNL